MVFWCVGLSVLPTKNDLRQRFFSFMYIYASSCMLLFVCKNSNLPTAMSTVVVLREYFVCIFCLVCAENTKLKSIFSVKDSLINTEYIDCTNIKTDLLFETQLFTTVVSVLVQAQ